MSGRPVRRRVLRDIRIRGGWPAVLEHIANGETVTSIAHSFNVSRSFFARLLHEDRERHELVREARKVAADALAEEALEIVDRANPTRDDLQHAKLRADFRVRLASKLDRDQYGDRVTPQVEISIGQLHLDALRAQAVANHLLPATTLALPPVQGVHDSDRQAREPESATQGQVTDATESDGRRQAREGD